MIYKLPIEDFFELFNIDKNIIESYDDGITEDIYDTFYVCHARKIREELELLSDEVGSKLYIDITEVSTYFIENSVEYTTDIIKFLTDEVESWFDNYVSNLFDLPVVLKIIKVNWEEIEFELISEDLLGNIGKGMDAYGMFDWHQHCKEDKDRFLDDGYLALRELLHYYEACESKPSIKFDYYRKEFWYSDDECTFWDKIKDFILKGEWVLDCDGDLELVNKYNLSNEVNIKCNIL